MLQMKWEDAEAYCKSCLGSIQAQPAGALQLGHLQRNLNFRQELKCRPGANLTKLTFSFPFLH